MDPIALCVKSQCAYTYLPRIHSMTATVPWQNITRNRSKLSVPAPKVKTKMCHLWQKMCSVWQVTSLESSCSKKKAKQHRILRCNITRTYPQKVSGVVHMSSHSPPTRAEKGALMDFAVSWCVRATDVLRFLSLKNENNSVWVAFVLQGKAYTVLISR